MNKNEQNICWTCVQLGLRYEVSFVMTDEDNLEVEELDPAKRDVVVQKNQTVLLLKLCGSNICVQFGSTLIKRSFLL